MNTLHMHNDYIILKLDEIIGLIKQPMVNPKSDLFYAIITLIVCLTIVFVAYYATKKYFDWKKAAQEKEIDQKDKERLNRVKDKEFELKKEYQAKVLDYLKGEVDSYIKIPKLITDIDKTSKLIDKLEDDDSNLKEIKELWGQICEKIGADKKFWQTIVEKSKDGSIKIDIDKDSIINFENNLYLSKLKDYIDEL